MDEKELCDLACNPSLDGYTPNPLYHAGYCPDYMKTQCNADGTMFERQWEQHQKNIVDFNARKMMSMTFHQRPQELRYVTPGDQSVNLPPSSSEVFRAMRSGIPTRPAINYISKSTTSKKKKKVTKKVKKVKKTKK